jgi:hypothetical protein
VSNSRTTLVLIALLTLLASNAFAATPQTVLFLNSQPGDYIGAGIQQTFTPANGAFTIQNPSKGVATVSFNGSGHFWNLSFASPTGTNLVKSEYEGAQRFAFHSPTKPGLDVFGDGRGCNIVKGRFLVSQLTFATDGSIAALAIDFEQHCEGATPALYGSMRFNSAVTMVPRVSVADATALKGNTGTSSATVLLSLSMPSSQAVTVQYRTSDGSAFQNKDYVAASGVAQFQPGTTLNAINIPVIGDRLARGNKVFHVLLSNPSGAPVGDAQDNVKILDANGSLTLLSMYGQPGDYISQGGFFLATIADGAFTTARNFDNGVSVSLNAGDHWSLDFAAPGNVTLTAGDYENAQRFPFQAAGLPGLSVYGAGRGCNTLTGRFLVKKAVYTLTGAVQRFSADFEQHCEGAPPGLFGSVRINSTLQQLSVTDAVIDYVNSLAVFSVTLNPASPTSVSIDFSTADGSGMAGIDYVATAQTLSFAPGQVQQTITVPLLSSNGGTKQFFGLLSAPTVAPIWIVRGAATF